MAPRINDLGVWSQYTPDPLPEWARLAAAPGQKFIFTGRNGLDWYDFRKAQGSFTDGYLLAFTRRDDAGTGMEIIQGVYRDRSLAAIPTNMRVIEIEDVDPTNGAPWKLYEQKIYDPTTKTISSDKFTPPIVSVRDYQFAGQAAAEGIISEKEADDWITVGTVPQKLIDAVTQKVTDADRQKRVLRFLKGTTVYPRDHELTPVLAASFGKDTPAKLDAFFLAASKL
jgi:hypothetical protein